MADLIVILILAFFVVIAARAVISARRKGATTCGCSCGDDLCCCSCGHTNKEHMSRSTRREVKKTIKELKKLQRS